MKTMLDFVKDALPEGAVIDSPKELASCYRFHFSYSGHSIKWEVPKTVAPGYEKKTAERTVATCMTQIFMETGEVEQLVVMIIVSQAKFLQLQKPQNILTKKL